ncbi:hypothetical protein WA026_008197 [Henosepilachna vigintioctopunctata]|uniref:Uncharacterized protein n=1 Tax=Henosepilachna vigintioctopunctata TaxID=420089 RepID=A0AAW1TS79_9CUCU
MAEQKRQIGTSTTICYTTTAFTSVKSLKSCQYQYNISITTSLKLALTKEIFYYPSVLLESKNSGFLGNSADLPLSELLVLTLALQWITPSEGGRFQVPSPHTPVEVPVIGD